VKGEWLKAELNVSLLSLEVHHPNGFLGNGSKGRSSGHSTQTLWVWSKVSANYWKRLRLEAIQKELQIFRPTGASPWSTVAGAKWNQGHQARKPTRNTINGTFQQQL